MKESSIVSSILAPDALVLILRKKYNLSNLAICKVLRTGINHSYLVADGDLQFVFRIYSYGWRSEMEIKEELRFLNILKENTIMVSYPSSDSSGNYIQRIIAPEGERFAVLFSFAKGQKVRSLSEDHCCSVGILLSKLHSVSVGYSLKRVNYNVKVLTEDPYRYATEHYSESLNEMQFVKKAGAHVVDVFGQANINQLRHGAVHLDIWYDNFNIDEKAITLFDFDFCGNGWLLLDAAYFAMQLFHTEPDKNLFKVKLERFFAGYESCAPISDEERKLLPLAGFAVLIFYLGVQSRRFDDWSNIFLTQNYFKHYIGMVKSWLDYNEIHIEA